MSELFSLEGEAVLNTAAEPEIFLNINFNPVLNFALQQNKIPVVKSAVIINKSESNIYNAELKITSVPGVCMPYSLHIDFIPAHSEYNVKNINVLPNADYLAGLTEKVSGCFNAELCADSSTLCTASSELCALAFDEWHGALTYPELLTAFVTPNHPAVASINLRAAELLGQWTGSSSLDGYQTDDANRVLKQAAAVYCAIAEKNIVYAVPPASFEQTGQRVRLCDTVINQRMGTCLDLTLLYVSCLEAAGLHPLLILKPGHIFAGVWLENLTFPEAVQDDKTLITKRLADGINELCVVECTMLAGGKGISFDDAFLSAKESLKEPIELFIDVTRARLSGISPLPVRVNDENGWHIEANVNVQSNAPVSAPQSVAFAVNTQLAANEKFTKKTQWERKLLDLGMRNSLINLRFSKNLIPILTSSLDELENSLSDGSDFSVLSRPGDYPGGSQYDFENINELGSLADVITAEFASKRLRSAYTETELKSAVKELYRSAKTSMEENGANTLYLALGLLRWYENEKSTKPHYAPLILLPVDIVRKSASAGYVIRLRDDEPQMNITLLEKLKQDFEITVTSLDTLPLDEHGIDTRTVFTVMRKAVMAQSRWDVLESAYLGIFSFSQFVMWNDIRNRSQELEKNKVVRSLIDGKLAWQPEDMEIGEYVSQDDVFLPMPADASQLFAIKAANKGESFVLHGPPGTGKSQTITVLIANALAHGKSVLFVAEKMAALEVVQKRLEKIGLGAFCMELHSNKANKRNVIEQLRVATEVSAVKSADDYEAKAQKLSNMRARLDGYCKKLHEQQPCGLSLYSIINIYEENKTAPDIAPLPHDFAVNTTAELLEQRQSTVLRLVAAAKNIGHPCGHPLKNIGCTAYSQQLKINAPVALQKYAEALDVLSASCEKICSLFLCDMPESFEALSKIASACGELARWKIIPRAWAVQPNTGKYFADVRDMSQRYINAAALRQKLLGNWKDEFFTEDGNALSNELRQNNEKWFLAKSIGMSGIVKRVSAYQKQNISKDELAIHFADLATYQAEKNAADTLFKIYGMDLCSLYNGENTDWQYIYKLADVATQSAAKLKEIWGSDDIRLNCAALSDCAESIEQFNTAWSVFVPAKMEAYNLLSLTVPQGGDWLEQNKQMCRNISLHFDELKEWITWQSVAVEAQNLCLTSLVTAYREGLEHQSVEAAYKKCAYGNLAAYAISGSEVLDSFSGSEFNEQIAQYTAADAQLEELTRKEIYCRLAAKVPNFTKEAAQSSEIGILQKAIRSGGRGLSIRKLFEEIPTLLPRLCPCMLMSPISAAQYLNPEREPFDLVVFDEASQLPTCKAVGALARGKNAVIVGDPKQMPPTSFFMTNTLDEDNLDEEDLESILDDCLAINMPQTHLLWHYRSRHESLIAFSNSNFYENKLYTFPSVNDRQSKVSFVHTEGCFDRGKTRSNRTEAEAVVNEIIRRSKDEKLSKMSVGVITFNVSQQNLIDDLLAEACRNDTALDSWAYGGEKPLFIKNLENVQGDERDVILFSVGYGADSDGKVSLNFGPLNRDGGWRRLNVAVSRARCEMTVFSSLYPDQINLSRTSAEGVAALRRFLEYAQSNRLCTDENSADQIRKNRGGVADSICRELEKKGYCADRAVGHSSYRIDIGVVSKKNPDKYILGIILDGSSYGEAKSTRDREIAQNGILNGLGWNLHRIWTMDWWDNSKKELEKVFALLESLENSEDDDKNGIKLINLTDENKTSQQQLQPEKPKTAVIAGFAVKTEDKNSSVKPYTFTHLDEQLLDTEQLLQPQMRTDIKNKTELILKCEAPVSESLLMRRLLQSYGISRSGSKISAYLSEVLNEMHILYTVYDGVKFYWCAGQNPESYSEIRANVNADEKRDAKDVPVIEAANAVYRVLEEQIGLNGEDLVKESAKLMGFTRLGTVVTPLFEGAISYLSEHNKITKDKNEKWILL